MARIRGLNPFELVIVLLVPALVVFTTVVLVEPAIVPAIIDDRLDMAINTAATLVALAVAVLGWGRYREAREESALFRGSAFAVLFLLNALSLVIMLTDHEGTFGSSLAAPGQLPVLAGLVARSTAAGLLVVGGLAALRPIRMRIAAVPILLVPSIVVVGVIAVASLVQGSLPMLISQEGLDQLRGQPELALLIGVTPVLIGLQAAIGLGYLVAAGLSYVAYRRGRRASEGYLCIGLLLAAFSQLHVAIHPGSFASLVTSGDVLRFGFYAALLVGIAVESRRDVRDVRDANAELQRLRESEILGAAVDERARLAREVHDGLAQDLWFAKLKQSRLSQLPELGAEARVLADEVTDAIDSALAEARQAVMAMGTSLGEAPFIELLARYVDDFGDRFGLRAEFEAGPNLAPLPARAQMEVLRIVQEALNNIRKHADATTVRVHVTQDAGGLCVSVADNGRGFDPSSVALATFGLESMRQRAAVMDATLLIDSELQNGTRITVRVPNREAGRRR